MNLWLLNLMELRNKLQNNPIKNGVAIYWINAQVEKLLDKELINLIE